uniref:Putative secreted salivary protein n=1 Tax=Ixodes ricinus TaxID=34613 RepID=A0A090X7W1_IXORI
MIWLLCLFTCASVTRVAANCNVEQAIEGMKDCKHGLHTIEKKSFNASNPEHVKEACCSATGRLEACLHTAVTSAGCLHEVDYVVQDVDEASTVPFSGTSTRPTAGTVAGQGHVSGPQPVAVVTTLSLATLLLTLFRTR